MGSDEDRNRIPMLFDPDAPGFDSVEGSCRATLDVFDHRVMVGRRGTKDVSQGLKPDVFSIIYGTTKVVP